MTNAALTLSDVLTIMALLGGFGGLWWRITAAIDKVRDDSEASRSRLYKHIDERFDKLESRFVSVEVYRTHRESILQAIDGLNLQVVAVNKRVCPFPVDKDAPK